MKSNLEKENSNYLIDNDNKILSVLKDTTSKIIQINKDMLTLNKAKKSLLIYALAHIQDTITQMSTSLSNTDILYDSFDAEDPKEVHRFLSVLNFIFCMPGSHFDLNNIVAKSLDI